VAALEKLIPSTPYRLLKRRESINLPTVALPIPTILCEESCGFSYGENSVLTSIENTMKKKPTLQYLPSTTRELKREEREKLLAYMKKLAKKPRLKRDSLLRLLQ